MKCSEKTNKQLINELNELQIENAEIKKYIVDMDKKQRQSEERLMVTEERYRSFFENTIVGIYQSSHEGHYIIVNPAFADIFGYDSTEEFLSLVEAPQLYVNKEDRVKSIQQVLRYGVGSFEIQVYRKDGSKIWISNYVRVVRNNDGNIIYFEGMVKDITQRKKAIEELNEYRQHLEEKVVERTLELKTANEKLQLEIIERKRAEKALINQFSQMSTIFDSINALVYVVDMESYEIVFINKYGVDVFGKSILGKKCYKVLQSNQFAPCSFCSNPLLICNWIPQPPYVWEHKNTVNNRWFQCIDRAITWIDGRLVRLEIGFDITERKQMEENLRLSEERFFKAFNFTPASMTIYSLESEKFIEANESCLKMHGYRREEFIGRSVLDLNLWVDIDKHDSFIMHIRKKGIAHNHEIRYYKKSGEISIALLSGIIIELLGEQCILAVKFDITELRQYQKELLRLDRLSLIGVMAAGIAHEIRNPMTTVKGFLQWLGGKKENLQNKEYYDLMIEEINRANSIISEFLSLTGNKTVDLKMQNLNSIIKAIFPLIQADAMVNDIYINLELEEISELLLNEKEIRQLILNLVRNGIEAKPSSEYLTIKTYSDGSEVVLSVQDKGKGIPSDILDKIGTPFLTTKDNGTGLGLATCYSIANRHNASINVNTGPDGTTFYVRFKLSV